MLTETKLDNLDKITIPEFVILSKPRKRKKEASGGVAILIRETIANNFQVLDTENDNACTIWIKMKGQPNNARTGELDNYIHTADNCFISNNNPILYDDAPHVLEIEKHGLLKKRCSKNHYVNKFGHKLLQMCKSLGLLIMNGRCNGDKGICKFTCKNTSVVDYCISSKNMIQYIDIHEFEELLSDIHCPRSLHISLLKINYP